MPLTYFWGANMSSKGPHTGTASINPICTRGCENKHHWLITILEMLSLVPADSVMT